VPKDVSYEHIDQAARLICGGRFEPELGVLLGDIAGQRKTRQLLEKLIVYSKYDGFCVNTDEEAIREVLEKLESVMPVSSLTALVLMARLFSRATELKVEYVSDSVIVWILRNKSTDLKRELEMLACEEANDKVRKHYQDWARVMPVTDQQNVGRVADR
jgi:hypothetical protein